MDRIERLDWAERWFADGFRIIPAPGGFAAVEVDMSRARALVEKLRAGGVAATLNHVIVRAAALALANKPELHFLVAGNRRLRPDRVDIGLSVAGRTSFAPVMVLEDAGRKPLAALSAEIVRRIPEVREKEDRDLAGMRRWGRLIPFASWRRAILRWLARRLWFRRQVSGTFQVTCLPADLVVPFLFNTAAALGVGRTRDRVVAVDGAATVRPTCTLAVAIDHAAWDGARLMAFQDEVKRILEEGVLEAEAAATSSCT